MPPTSLVLCSGRYLSFAEREELALLKAQRCGVREIARRLGRSPSTISRELRRNAATRGGKLEYRATVAQWKAERAARRPKTAKLAENDRLRQYVQDRLAGTIRHPDGAEVPGPDVRWVGRRHGRRQDRRWATAWSPEQIANRLPIDLPDDESMRISHEAIYQALYVQGRGALRRELTACLRTGRALRVPRARTRGRGKKFAHGATATPPGPSNSCPASNWGPSSSTSVTRPTRRSWGRCRTGPTWRGTPTRRTCPPTSGSSTRPRRSSRRTATARHPTGTQRRAGATCGSLTSPTPPPRCRSERSGHPTP